MSQTLCATHPTDSSLDAWVMDTNETGILCHTTNNTLKLATLRLSSAVLDLLHHFEYVWTNSSVTQAYDDKVPVLIISLQGLLRIGIIKHNKHNDDYVFNGKTHSLINYRLLLDHLSVNQLHSVSHAIQLLRWIYDFRYCNRCGANTHTHQQEYAQVCPNCAYRNYPRISPCVIVAIYKNDGTPKILLAKHHRHSQMYGLIAGFMEVGESCENAIMREVKEEVGLYVKNIQYIGSQPWPYPSNLMLGFLAEYDGGEICIAEDELSHADFFDFDNLPIIPKNGTIARTLIDLTHKQLSD